MTVLFFILDNFRDSSGILFGYYAININGREKVISSPASNDRLVFFLLFYGCKRMGCLRLNPDLNGSRSQNIRKLQISSAE